MPDSVKKFPVKKFLGFNNDDEMPSWVSFREGSIIDLPSLAIRLANSTDAFDAHVSSSLSAPTIDSLKRFAETKSDEVSARQALITDLNNLLIDDRELLLIARAQGIDPNKIWRQEHLDTNQGHGRRAVA